MLKRYFGIGILLLLITVAVVWSVSVAQTTLSLRRHLIDAKTLAEDPAAIEPTTACGLVQQFHSDITSLEQKTKWLVRLAPFFGWLPKVGGDLRAAPHLLTVGDRLAKAGVVGCQAFEPTLKSMGDNNNLSVESIAHLLTEHQTELEEARSAVESAQTAWERIDEDSLSPFLAEQAALLDRGMPLVQAGMKATEVAPQLLGMEEQRTYLVLALNEDELRPGGGFISGVGEIHVKAGELITMTFRDSYMVDDFSQPYPDPPDPLRRYMGIDLWVFRDSNWSPDFPTAARQAIKLYRPGYPITVDGVIALDQRAVQGLIDALGPLTLNEAEKPIDGDTILTYIHQSWAPGEGESTGGWWKQRKSFMGTIAKAAWERVQNGHTDWANLLPTVLRLLEEKHLLIYLQDSKAATIVGEQGWDGALEPNFEDFLMVIDANLGYNKATAKIQQSIEYQVDLNASPPQAHLTLVYTHTSTRESRCVFGSRYDTTYEQMTDRCYWDYLRVYVPKGSQLLDANSISIPGRLLWSEKPEPGKVSTYDAPEGPWLSWEVMNVIPRGVTQTRSMTWTLPSDVLQWQAGIGQYSLVVQKQPGTGNYPLTIQVILPVGSKLLKATPAPSDQGRDVVYQTLLDRDRKIVIHLEGGNSKYD